MSDKRARWDRALIQRNYSTRKFLIELDEQQRASLASIVTRQMCWRSRWDNATSDYINTFATNLNHALYDEKLVTDTITNSSSSYIESYKSEDDMCKLSIERADGNVYLLEDCGCGQINRYVLTAYDEGYAGDPANGSVSWPSNAVRNVSRSQQSCYATKAASILADAFKDYASRVVDVLNLGLDAYNLTFYADGVGELLDIANNSNAYNSIKDISKEALLTAIDTYKPLVQQEFTQTGELTRRELQLIVFAVYPQIDGVIPLQFLADKWAFTANLKQLNARLAVAATECERNVSLTPQIPQADFIENVNNVDYLIWKFTNVDVSAPWISPFQVTNFECISTYASGISPLATDRDIEYANQNLGSTGNGRFNDAIWLGRTTDDARDALYQARPEFDSPGTYQTLLSTPTASNGYVKITGSKSSPALIELWLVARA